MNIHGGSNFPGGHNLMLFPRAYTIDKHKFLAVQNHAVFFKLVNNIIIISDT